MFGYYIAPLRFFYFFIFVFYKNIFSIWKFTGIYPGRPAAGRPGPGRPVEAYPKKKTAKNCRLVPGCRSPGSGAAGPLAVRLLGGRLSHPYIRVGWSPTPHLHHYNSKNKEKREREGERRSPAGFSSRRLQVTKILLRFTNSMIVYPDMSSNYFCCNYFC